jgi:hypothetical protein
MPRRPSSARAPLKRWTLVKLPLSLLAGAVVTWGVAWGCALWHDDFTRPSNATEYQGERAASKAASVGIPIRRRDGFTELEIGDNSAVGLKVSYANLNQFFDERYSPRVYNATVTDLRAGWPLLALQGAVIFDNELPSLENLFPLPPRVQSLIDRPGRSLPLRILPLGFALNTLLAAGVLLTLVEGFAFARRRVRRAKGRCPSCGYDRGGLAKDAACPECGAGSSR